MIIIMIYRYTMLQYNNTYYLRLYYTKNARLTPLELRSSCQKPFYSRNRRRRKKNEGVSLKQNHYFFGWLLKEEGEKHIKPHSWSKQRGEFRDFDYQMIQYILAGNYCLMIPYPTITTTKKLLQNQKQNKQRNRFES
jgi:hypothetical protein